MALNSVVIMGRLTDTPELRKTNNGTSVTSFTVAVDKGKDQGADFFDCTAWTSVADHICKWWTKGKMIAIQGRLTTRSWEDKNGNKRKSTEVVCEQVSFCGDKDNGQQSNRGTAVDFGGKAGVPVDFGFVEDDSDDRLPFDLF